MSDKDSIDISLALLLRLAFLIGAIVAADHQAWGWAMACALTFLETRG